MIIRSYLLDESMYHLVKVEGYAKLFSFTEKIGFAE